MKGDLISGAIMIAIVTVSSIIVLNNISPMVEEGAKVQAFNEARNTLTTIDSAINQVIFEAPGSQRQIDVDVRDGRVFVSGKEERVGVFIDEFGLFEPGTVEESGVTVSSGTLMSATEKDADGDGSADLVLENDAVLFAVEKKGSPDSHVFVNTSTFIPIITNKRSGVNITPTSGIRINDLDNTSYGFGFTELTRSGSNLQSAGIHLYLNSTGNVTYDATFSLKAQNDFVELEVRNIRGAVVGG